MLSRVAAVQRCLPHRALHTVGRVVSSGLASHALRLQPAVRSSLAVARVPAVAAPAPQRAFANRAHLIRNEITPPLTPQALANQQQHSNVYRYIQAFRSLGHLYADVNPLRMFAPPQLTDCQELTPQFYGLDANADTQYPTEGLVTFPDGRASATLAEITERLKATYCSHITAELGHLVSGRQREWLARELESVDLATHFTPGQKRNIHTMILRSETFDHFMQRKFTSFKRYGLEGAESVLAGLQYIMETASGSGVKDVVIGMPHRGRFNFLISLLDYPARSLFHNIKGLSDIPEGMWGYDDVTSHIAQSITKKFDKVNDLHVTMLHNPSHLEAVNPVSQGKARAKQDLAIHANPSTSRKQVMCLQLHGDAAFAGQGVVQESLLLTHLPFFTTGGTVHLIVNNQLGFTTGPEHGRSNLYSSDVTKMVNMPVLRVNADDPEAVVFACQTAVKFRQEFETDILIDVIGYRRWGHNEVDEPGFTQPLIYQDVRSRPSVVTTYTQQLQEQGLMTPEAVKKATARLDELLEAELAAAPTYTPPKTRHFQGNWAGYTQPKDMTETTATGVDKATLQAIGRASVARPDGFTLHPRLERMFVEPRLKSLDSGKDLDWATAEALAFGTLLTEGYNLRLTGQDVERGTFSQRHGVFIDQKTEKKHTPLALLTPNQGFVQYVPSPLSELAVMAYEYGYNIDSPKTLNIWEAQFGDFFNGAQVTIDAFVTSSEAKWLRACGLTILLPHGYDGAGPEHSSCRIERWLQLTDGNEFADSQTNVNFVFANPTTPANYFHLLRRQMLRNYRKPLVVAAPKTLLRHAEAVSTLDQMAPNTSFQSVFSDPNVQPEEVEAVLLCSGKLYYDLVKERDTRQRKDIAIVRLEELAPFPFAQLSKVLNAFPRLHKASKKSKTRVVWVQEEPSNMGAWSYVHPRLEKVTAHLHSSAHKVVYHGREALPQPAVGIGALHKQQVEYVTTGAFKLLE